MEPKIKLLAGFSLRRFFVGIALSIVFIFLFLYRINLRKMLSALVGVNYLMAIAGAIFYFFSMALRNWRWQYLLRPLSHIRFKKLFPILIVGYTINNLLPFRVGEIVRAHYLGEREGISKISCFATIVVERVFDGLVLLFLITAVSLFVPFHGLLESWHKSLGIHWIWLALGLGLPFPLGLVILFIIRWRFSSFDRLLMFLHIPSQLRGLAALFAQGLGALKGFRSLLFFFLISLPTWLAEIMTFWVVAYAFGLERQLSPFWSLPPLIILTASLANLASSLPSVGGIGPFELGAQATLTFLGVSIEVASSYIIVIHALEIIPVTILGLVFLWWLHLPVKPILRGRAL